ncbi:tRNA (N6-threonylcarbamoyladenosine(37)-N6)-methyltransferase TrmO [Aliikangiella sp. G2MR2-5]|uniref:tRNA (N6-threonylcarbamoyladenosine(37)-N6)-methyltransferase TrmO n=1 Tax=Aliikangiella sp. G2MR2-5 TaxID=2788943 RepID=UPI0018A9436C|nr:tRNA (N6-threonylcarbamoyladenosine(37)-N6)-methyltransferase TrmO [Aliikangiella sp. G2MR2-5]
MSQFTFEPIGIIKSPFKQKFAIPRQPGLAPHAIGELVFSPPFDQIEMLAGLEDFSHLWISFVFHQTLEQGWSPRVRPPRLGGNKKVGVFATRSTFRPNPIGLSVVKLLKIEQTKNQLLLKLGGIDLLDGTPVLDIKPYIPYADSLSGASAGFANDKPPALMTVKFSAQAQSFCEQSKSEHPFLMELIDEVLAQDPRPAYRKNKKDEKEYAVQLYSLDIHWLVTDNTQILVTSIKSLKKK